ncbi:MAG: ComF family protein [Eubacteriales bacterium]|nr:ComF family protein [Eubacteriales bacterium]MDD4630183.1 ComF family protein [Eubacteriales bacterium]
MKRFLKLWWILSSLGEGFLELVYPSNIYCISCGNIIDDSRPYSLCDTCIRTLKWANERTCDHCGKILQESYGPDLCSDCIETEHVFEKGYTCVEYTAAERDILHRLKYKNQAYLGRKLAEIMYDRMKTEDIKPDIVVPVPMHVKKYRKRGYNQAAVLGKSLAKFMEKPYEGKLLFRIAETEAMSSLGALARKENIRQAFDVHIDSKNNLAGKNVMLVDDIYTTGSTADACAAALQVAGAAKIYVITFAAGANLMKGEGELF